MKKKSEKIDSKRRLIHIGPGLIITIVALVFVLYKYNQVQKQIHQQSNMPPIVERQMVYSGAQDKVGPTPEVKFVSDRSHELALSNTQTAKLEKLQSDWREYYEPKMKEAREEASKTDLYLSKSKDKSRTPVAQIQNAAGPVITLSREMSAKRRAYWDQAMLVLTPAQRQKVEQAREADWAARQKAISDKVRELTNKK